MVDVSRRDKLQVWLKTQPPQVSIVFAGRAALRVAPLYNSFRGEDTFSAKTVQSAYLLPMFRALVVSRLAGLWPYRLTSVADATRAADAAADAATPAGDAAANAASAGFAAAYVAAAADADAASMAAAAGGAAALAAADAAAAAAYAAAAGLDAKLIRRLKLRRSSGRLAVADEIRPVALMSLWQGDSEGGPFAKDWASQKRMLEAGSKAAWVWVEFYERALSGAVVSEAELQAYLAPTEEEWKDFDSACKAIARELAQIGVTQDVTSIDHSTVQIKPIKINKPAPVTVIGQAILANAVPIVLNTEPLVALIDKNIDELKRKIPNDPEKFDAHRDEIERLEKLRASLVAQSNAARDYANGNTTEDAVVTQTKSFRRGISEWWTKHSDEICHSTWKGALFLGMVGIAGLAGGPIGGALGVVVAGIFVGKQPVADALKDLWKAGGKTKKQARRRRSHDEPTNPLE